MKDDGRLKSLGILLVMIGVIVGFFAMFQRKPSSPVAPLPAASVGAARGVHREAPLPAPAGTPSAPAATRP